MYNLKFARNKNISSLYNSAESTMLLARSSNQSEKCQREKFYNTLLVCHQDNITKITLNRPERKNAINEVMFAELMDALDDSATDDSVLTVITGFILIDCCTRGKKTPIEMYPPTVQLAKTRNTTVYQHIEFRQKKRILRTIEGNGEFFSSGIDLSILLSSSPEDIKTLISPENIQCFIKKFIDFPKPVVAVINGPTIGIFVTLLCLFDLVFTTEKATFQTLFSQLALCPEGCSTYTFPLLMGPIKANEMLLFNKKLTAQKALDLGLVNEVFPDNTFQQDVWTKLKEYAALPRESLALSKQLIRGMIKDQLYTACVNESDRFIERWKSEEFKNAFFLKIKSKL